MRGIALLPGQACLPVRLPAPSGSPVVPVRRSTASWYAVLRYGAALLATLLCLARPTLAASNADYTLGEGDVVKILVYDHPDLTTETQITADGQITFPLLGRVQLMGLTFNQAEKMVASKLESAGMVKSPNVTVMVTQYRSRRLSVLGEVNKPGRMALDSPTSLAEALALAGGVTPTAGNKVVLIRADGNGKQTRTEFTVAELLDDGVQGRAAIAVQAGDILFVPKAEQFFVYGEVQRPGMYRLDRPTNVMQALSMGGGFNTRANTSRLTVFRKQPDGSVKEYTVRPDDPIRDGDVLFIKESLF